MNKETRKLIREKIGKSSIPDEVKLMYIVACACQYLVEHCDSRIRNVFASCGVKTRGNDLLSGLNDYSKAVKMASARFYDRIEGQIIGATYDIGGAESYDSFNGDATELIRLMMLYIDRTAHDSGKAGEVFALLDKMPSLGIFKDEDIEHFKTKG